jgi:hypothetical protein
MSAPYLCRTQPVVAATEAKTAVFGPQSTLQAAACRALLKVASAVHAKYGRTLPKRASTARWPRCDDWLRCQ